MDALDGYFARKFKAESPFGRQLDSNVDIFVFIVYPALALYCYFGLRDVLSVAVICIFVGAGVFRLARFNVAGFLQMDDGKRIAYNGLPVFFSHFTLLVLLGLRQFTAKHFVPAADLLIFINGIAMVMKFPFTKPKTLWPFLLLIAAASLTMLFMDYNATH